TAPAAPPRPLSLKERYARLHREMVEQLEYTVARENHWRVYLVLGWEHLAACAATHYLVEVEGLQYPYRWPYLVVGGAGLVRAGLTSRGLRPPGAGGRPPLAWHSTRTWAVFFLLCGNVVALNMFAGLPVFVFLPVLATLSSFAFSVLVGLVSRKFGL